MALRILSAGRWIGAVLAGAVALALSVLVVQSGVSQLRFGFHPGPTIFSLALAVMASLLWRFAMFGHRPESRARILPVLVWALAGGLTGLAAGLLTMLVTGVPLGSALYLGAWVYLLTAMLGFLLGATVGYLRVRLRRPEPTN